MDMIALAEERLELHSKIKKINIRIAEIEFLTGMDKIKLVEIISGTNTCEWLCTVCKTTLIYPTKGLCPVCHPIEERKV